MLTTRLSSKGQIIIPKPIRVAYQWVSGLDLVVIEMNGGILLKPKTPFLATTLKEVASCLRYQGKPKTLDDMEDAIKQGVMERFNGCR
jgi:AbrB family looped-hinge helix DNA binding protein